MNFDSTLDFALIISIVALISPALVELVRCIFQYKLKKYELFETNNYQILNNFINATLDCKKDKIGFYKAYNQVYLYCNIWGDIKPKPLRIVKQLVEKDAPIEEINNALRDFVFISNTNKERIKLKQSIRKSHKQ